MPYWNLSVCCLIVKQTEFIKTRYEFYTISTEIQKSMWNYWTPYEIFHKNGKHTHKKKTRYWFKQLSFHKPHSKSLNRTMCGEGGGTKRHTVRLTAVFEQQHAVGQSHIFSSAIAVKLWNTGIAPADRAALRTKSTRALAQRNSNLIAHYR